MAVEKKQKRWQRWVQMMRFKYRLVLLNDETFEEKLSFRLSRLNVFVALGSLSIFLIIITIYIIAFTPLREYIPGYASISGQTRIYSLLNRTDSLEKAINERDKYILNIKNIILGREMEENPDIKQGPGISKDKIVDRKSREDSILRAEIEGQDRYSLSTPAVADDQANYTAISSFLFFSPVRGIVTNSFNPVNGHYGVDVTAKKNEAVKATLEGTVIFSDWTLETGYTIGIQHRLDLISVYRHNAYLLKKTGAVVRAGEPVAIIGNSGELSTGPHLHFELWYNGSPVNPKDYMAF